MMYTFVQRSRGKPPVKVIELLHTWEATAKGALTEEAFSVRLPVEDAAKLKALHELYPKRSMNDLITDLLAAALSEVESSLPYVRGDEVVAIDEQGDPCFADAGPTPLFLALMRKHMSTYQTTIGDSSENAH